MKTRNQITQLVFALICLFITFNQSLYSQDCPYGGFDCPFIISVCPGEEFKITDSNPVLPALPSISPDGPASVYEQTNYTYSFDIYQDDVKICDNCHNQTHRVYTPTLYRVEISYNSNHMVFYVRAEIKECGTEVDLIGDSFLLGDLSNEGSYGLSVKYKNNGPGYLINTDIVYEINETIIDTFKFTGPTISPGQSRSIDFGSYYFESNTDYTVKVWSTNPNGGIDLNATNDTVTRFYSAVYGEVDLAMDSFTSLSLPMTTGNKTVSLRLQNFSNTPINQYEIYWSINGNLQSPYSVINPTLNTEDNYFHFDIANYYFDENQDYEIKAWTVLPTGITDTNPLNDTITFTYKAAANDYYSADAFYEICPGETLTFTSNLFSGTSFNCHTCDNHSASVKWLIDGVVVMERYHDNILSTCYEACYVSFAESFTSAFQTSALVELQAISYSDCHPIIGCSNGGATGATPPSNYHVNKSFGIFVNDCGTGTTEPPVTTEPDCANNSGTMYFDNCDGGQQYFLIEMEDGTIYDPYYGPGISFEHFNGQKLNFDYTIAPFASPCELASAAITITCIEEVPLIPVTEDDIFSLNPWLTELVDISDCNGQSISFYDQGAYAFIHVDFGNDNAQLFLDDGSLYCTDGIGLDCTDAYDLTNPDFVWTCNATTPPTNPPTGSNQLFEDYNWLGNLVDQNNCQGTTVNIFDLGAYAFIQIIDENNATLYFEDGTYYCQDGNNLNCVQAYNLGNPTDTWTCGEGTTTTPPTNPPTGNNQLFEDYNWLNNLVDQNDCQGTTINEFDLGAYAFIQIIDGNNATLYFEDGTYYCQDGNNLNCVQAYNLGNPTDTWTCGEGNPNPPATAPAIFDKYPWLSDFYSSTNCSDSYVSITEFDLGAYAFIYVQGNEFGMLYFEDGTPYCDDANFGCLDIYGLTDPTDITLCSADKPAGDDSGNIANEEAYKTSPVELVPIWSVYPNPTSGSFTVDLDGQRNDLNLISIYNVQGKVIEEVSIENNQTTLNFNLEHLDTGMYFVALQYGEKTEVKKLMIK